MLFIPNKKAEKLLIYKCGKGVNLPEKEAKELANKGLGTIKVVKEVKAGRPPKEEK